YEYFIKKCIEKLSGAWNFKKECLDMVYTMFDGDVISDGYQKNTYIIESDYMNIKIFRDIFSSGRLPDSEEIKRVKKYGRLSGTNKIDKELKDILKKKRDKYKDIVSKVIDMCNSVDRDYKLSAEITEILAEMIKKYHAIIWERKCAKNAITFDDGERIALEILAETDSNGNIVQSDIAKKIAEFYDIIMIDEYQDSNNKQDIIFKLISKNYRHDDNGNALYGNNAFLVGDVKQSIYRFRLANPKNFVSTLKNSEPYKKDSTAPNKKIFLNQNFRSSPEVIDFVNYVFSNIMSEKCGDIEYTDDEKLNFDPKINFGEHDNSRLTHISFINTDEIEDDETNEESNDEKESSVEKRRKRNKSNPEAIFTAHKIENMLKNGYEVSEQGIKRRCKPSDFCILVRNNDLINIYANELEKLGIPARTHEDKGYLESREIAVLLDLLRVINNPLTDISVMAVLTSPMYMFSNPEMAFIKSLDREKPLFVIILGIVNGEYENCDTSLVERCKVFTESLDKFRLDSVTMTVGELISRIYDTTDFISVMQLYSDGDKKRANLRLLIQHAKNYEKSVSYEGAGGLNGFLRHIDRVIKNGGYKQEKTAVSSGDYVSIMTLHGSKGLEFTFVFIAENNIKFKYDTSKIMCSPDGRIGYHFYDRMNVKKFDTFQRAMLMDDEKTDTRSESARLMYVGFTRAKQQLFINLKYNKDILGNVENLINKYVSYGGDDIKNLAVSADRFSDWIWLCLMNHADFKGIAEKFFLDVPEPKFYNKVFEYEFCDNPAEQKTEEVKEYIEVAPDDNICNNIYNIIYNSYDNRLSEIPAKLSVTQITRKYKEDEIFDFKLKRPAFMSETGGLTGAERGTAIHTFFQYCNFENAMNNPENEIKRLANMGYISPVQAECINPYKIKAFFASNLYERISSSFEVWREKKFMVAVSQLALEDGMMEKFRNSDGMIKGIIDLMFEEADGLVIVDYKSDRGVSAKRLAERYAIQIQLYKSAVELTTGKHVKAAYLYSIEMEKEIEIRIN
ncbi:MAG: UvrD-helicase domain-containing protein, partial [Ruminococcus sp.]|nr:UvrD-helicase domain-containing protein [Ruminococcus sp.]